MVIEHSFVTTLEAAETMQTAGAFLRWRGFEAEAATAFEVGQAAWTTLQLRRGKKRAARAKSIAELPQLVRIEWDRGRVSVAASITPRAGGSGRLSISAAQPKVNSRTLRLHVALMTAIADSLDLLLAQNATPEQAAVRWLDIEQQIADQARRQRRRRWILLGVFLAIVAFVVVIAIMASTRR